MSDPSFVKRYGPWAIVTGSAQGIGRAFAEGIARRGLNLHLLDIEREAVTRVAAEIEEGHGVEARPLIVDLSKRDLVDEVEQAVADTHVGLLVCNAAFGRAGPFLDETPEALYRAVDVNCAATIVLTRVFASKMADARRGGILLVASETALRGSPGYAGYAATKAFDLVLGESLWYELREYGVDVLSFVPGPTNTPGLRSAVPGLQEGQVMGAIQLPETTAEAAIAALGRAASAAREPEHEALLEARRRLAETRIAEGR